MILSKKSGSLLFVASVCCVAVLLLTGRDGFASAKIRDIDFKNFVYPWDDPETDNDNHARWFWMSLPDQTTVRLQDGMHRFLKKPGVSPAVDFQFAVYGDLDGDGVEDAAVALNYSPGGTSNWDYLYVYKGSSPKPKLLGRLRAGSRAYGGLVRASIENGLLILDFNDEDTRTGDCCSDRYIRVRYRWQRAHFVEEGPREKGYFDPNAHAEDSPGDK